MNSLLSDKFGSLSLGGTPSASSKCSQKWQHWIYDCKDFPIHEHFYINNRPNVDCHFCLKVKNLKSSSPQSEFESKENFLRYIEKGRKFCSVKAMKIVVENAKEGILPSQLAEYVFFNRKLGAAFFRDGIPPNNEHPSNALGGNFQLLLLGTTGNKKLLEKFDNIFNKIFEMTFNELEMGKQCGNAINGIFIRCEINPGKNIKHELTAYNDSTNLPFMIKIEIWIGNNWNQAIVEKELIKKIKPMVEMELIDKIERQLKKQIKLSQGILREFQYHLADRQRIRLWLFECRDRPLHNTVNNKKCTGNECQYCIEVSKHFDGAEYHYESFKHWKDYIKEDELIQSHNLMLNVIENSKEKIMPSFLAKSISFNRKLGAAFFLNGIEPNYEHPICDGNFPFLFYGTSGNDELLAKFDQIVKMVIEDWTNSPNRNSINGIFLYCEINPNEYKDNNNRTNLPFLFKLEVWIRNHFEKEHNKIKSAFIDKIVEKLEQMNLPTIKSPNYISHESLINLL